MGGRSSKLTRVGAAIAIAAVALCFAPGPARALDQLDFLTPGADEALRQALMDASLVKATSDSDERNDNQEMFAAAQADYARLLAELYDAGFFGPTISIRIDGREAATIAPFDTPDLIERIRISVDPGPKFTFGRAEIAPLPPGTTPPPEFRTGAPASIAPIRRAAEDAITAWREAGHAKAAPAGDEITANHRQQEINARVAIDPGPRLRFGGLTFDDRSAVRPERLRAIAGFPSGAVFSPDALEDVGDRLRRTGTFSTVALSEAETANPDGTLDIEAAIVDRKPRRFGFGAEISSTEGLAGSAYWMHRNAFGGAEQLRFDAEVSGIAGDTGGLDFGLGGRLSRPATFGPDTSAVLVARLERHDEPEFFSDTAILGGGLSHIFSDTLTGEARLELRYADTRSDLGAQEFLLMTLPIELSWDRRDDALDATRGFYLDATATPYLGLNDTQSGAQLKFDAATYVSLGDRLVIAGRAQLGSVVGSSTAGTLPDYLFFSGGGGTVRGHAYHSLGVPMGRGLTAGGRSFMGGSLEVRSRVSNSFGVVGFYDIGYVGASSFPDGTGSTHSGAGLGLRYNTGIGPIRVDVATPVSGPVKGSRVQIYIGIGQSF